MATIKPVGDCALTVEFENEISIPVNRKVHALDARLQALHLEGVVETVPTYRTLLVYYRPEAILYSQLAGKIRGLLDQPMSAQAQQGLVVELPVLYGGPAALDDESVRYDGWDGLETAPDLAEVAAFEQLTPEEVVRRHTAHLHYVYFQSFAVGHSYLGCSQKSFTISRRKSPRTRIPRGSIAIWADQTVLNGFDLPCGWQVIGRTPVVLYDTRLPEPGYCQPGQWIRFVAITPEEYRDIHQQALAGTYRPVAYPLEEGGAENGL